MTSFFRHIKAALHFGKHHRYVPTEPSFWTPQDAERLAHFFNKESTGLKLKIILGNQITGQAVSAVQSTDNLAYQCGWARGVRGLVSVIESLGPNGTLSPSEAHSEPSDGSSPGADEFAATYAP